ncbi:hypothetical protein HYPSUDRAFT_205079 [Hypholoma sublateritium FD-334 SS-4]|uniref:Uncharacterized protein n=1 Tax=Hypholoma sublateritium (strain FD-334 SS-4) TaxID=945553 RepID=A0A0D2KW07_HYPSF|nr:hypothetical protein HYPSUDRAFT_205079 [Hypholoma sublateritium FD-334 SS-4]
MGPKHMPATLPARGALRKYTPPPRSPHHPPDHLHPPDRRQGGSTDSGRVEASACGHDALWDCMGDVRRDTTPRRLHVETSPEEDARIAPPVDSGVKVKMRHMWPVITGTVSSVRGGRKSAYVERGDDVGGLNCEGGAKGVWCIHGAEWNWAGSPQ